MRIGICGGTFDPVHRGHTEPVLAVRELFEWDQVLYVPAFRQPFKTEGQSVSGYHRYAMTVLATEEIAGFLTSTVELDRQEVSFTIDTLRALRQQYGRAAGFDWVIGDDNLPMLASWRALDEIFQLANFAVLTRGKSELPETLRERVAPAVGRPKSGKIVFAENVTVEISSTTIRERIQQGQPFEELMHPRVARYIHSHQLYRRGTD